MNLVQRKTIVQARQADSTHNETSTEGGHGHGGEVIEETPPNYTVLSVFGAINLSFLVVGLWNKRIRKKVELDVNAGKKT